MSSQGFNVHSKAFKVVSTLSRKSIFQIMEIIATSITKLFFDSWILEKLPTGMSKIA
jgi:hypothetical protein